MNENWDSDVRKDMSDALDRIVPEDKGGCHFVMFTILRWERVIDGHMQLQAMGKK